MEPFAILSADGSATAMENSPHKGYGLGGSNGGSGAGYGGSGGRGYGLRRVGIPYGDYRKPILPGSTGGANIFPFKGGRGGGSIRLVAYDTLVADGAISSCGGVAESTRSGGGSGGSILVYASRVHGDGTFMVDGGKGDSSTKYYGGGGAAGRIALYYRENHFLGDFLGAGGSSSFEPGGPGSVYLELVREVNGTYLSDPIDFAAHFGRISHEDMVTNGTKTTQNRTLYINARGKTPRSAKASLENSYTDLSLNAESRCWLTLNEERAGSSRIGVMLDELHLYGGAQLLVVRPIRPRSSISIVIGHMKGDRTGKIHLGFNQSFLSLESHLPMNMAIYRVRLILLCFIINLYLKYLELLLKLY